MGHPLLSFGTTSWGFPLFVSFAWGRVLGGLLFEWLGGVQVVLVHYVCCDQDDQQHNYAVLQLGAGLFFFPTHTKWMLMLIYLCHPRALHEHYSIAAMIVFLQEVTRTSRLLGPCFQT
jgi:hypothetical protein